MTLIELLTTVVIMGIVSTMAMPRFKAAWEKLAIRSETREITSTLRLARSMAVANKAQYGVYFDGSNKTITLFKDIVNLSSYQYDVGDSLIRVDTLPPEYTYLGTDMDNDVLVFRPNGSAKFTGGGNIHTMASTETVVGIMIHNVLASTGRVQVDESFY